MKKEADILVTLDNLNILEGKVVSLEETIVQLVLKKVTQVAKERNLDEEGIKNYIDTALRVASTEGVKVMADGLTTYLTRQIPEMIDQERTLQTAFEQRLYERWQRALDLFDATVILTREAGEQFLTKYREQAVKENATLIEALVRIHMRACQTASAISVLLKGGFARDAMARQRTLHELAVVAFLLKEHGDWLCCKNDEETKMVGGPRGFSLGDDSKQCGDQRDLPFHVSFFHPLHLPFPQHVHHLESL